MATSRWRLDDESLSQFQGGGTLAARTGSFLVDVAPFSLPDLVNFIMGSVDYRPVAPV